MKKRVLIAPGLFIARDIRKQKHDNQKRIK